ncbi:efflux RND transporter permease subunit [Mycoplasmatota bacterium]|nr:efflux RND transporter permease subunit [Mycoplasmatota bacterium]
MRRLLDFVLGRKVFVLVVSIILLFYGIYSYITIPKQEMPDMIAPMGIVQIIAPGLSATEIEETITYEIEDLINSYDEVEKYSSTTLDNVAFISLEYDFDVKDTSAISNEIKSELSDLELPDEVIERHFITDFDIPHAIYAVHSNSSFLGLKEDALDFKNDLLDINHVKSVKIDSPHEKYVEVNIDFEMLVQNYTTLKDVYGSIYANGYKIPLGSILENGEFISVFVNPNYKSINELENLVVGYRLAESQTIPLFLKDIASIELKEVSDNKEYYYKGKEAVLLEVYFDENIDFTAVGDDLREVMNKFNSTNESSNASEVNFIPEFVDEQISQAMNSLLLCILIVMVVVMIGLGVRNTVGIAFTIPIIVFTTISVLDIAGYELQKVSIAGIIISIGILVDNSIVISESIQYHLDRGSSKYDSCKNAVKDNAVAVLSSTLTTVAAFIPLAMLPGLAGQMAGSLPLTVMTAIILSYIFAMLVTPVLASLIFRPKKRKKDSKKRVLETIMNFTLSNAWLIITFSIVLVIGTLSYVGLEQPIEIFPPDEKTHIYIDYEYESLDKEKTTEYALEIESVLKDDLNVDEYTFSVGGSLPLFSLNVRKTNEIVNVGRFYLNLDLEIDEISDYVNSLQDKIDAIDNDYGSASVKQITLGMDSASVELLLMSYNANLLENTLDKIRNDLNQLSNIRSFNIIENTYKQEYNLEIDDSLLTQYGLTVFEIEEFIAIHLNGLSADVFSYNNNKIAVLVKSNFTDIKELLNLSIIGRTSKAIQLKDLIKINETATKDSIYRYNSRQLVTIEAEPVINYSSFKLENDIEDIINKHITSEIKLEYGGDTALTRSIFNDLVLAAIIAVVLIYLIMFVQFNSYKQPLIVFITIPLSLIGSSVMLVYHDAPISLTSLLGVVSLIGVVVNTGILLVDYINKAVDEGIVVFDACILAVKRRLRPILLASITTIMGLIPLVMNGGEFFSPLAIVFMGGIMASTILTLFVVPAMYYVLEK